VPYWANHHPGQFLSVRQLLRAGLQAKILSRGAFFELRRKIRYLRARLHRADETTGRSQGIEYWTRTGPRIAMRSLWPENCQDSGKEV